MVNKITWQKAGRVTGPGRYMFTFGWLTVAAEDIAVWEQFPNASFTLVKTAAAPVTDAGEEPGEEFRLGAFDLGDNLSQQRQKVRVALGMFEDVPDFVVKAIAPVPNAARKEER